MEQQIFIRIAILGCVGIVGFAFNSTLYVTLPVLERQLTLK